MTCRNNQVTALALLSAMGQRLLGREVATLAIGDWPGGVARVTELRPDPAAPEIVFNVQRQDGRTVGVFGDELVRLIRRPVAASMAWEVPR
jgi:hypothetical protein